MGKNKAVPDVISAHGNSIYVKYAEVISQYSNIDTLETSFSTMVSDDESSEVGEREDHTSSRDENIIDFLQPQSNLTQYKNQEVHVIPDDDSAINSGSATDTTNQDNSESSPFENQENEDREAFEVQRVPEDLEIPASSDQAELLRWHYRLGHCSFFSLVVTNSLFWGWFWNGIIRYNTKASGKGKIPKVPSMLLRKANQKALAHEEAT